mmetsp:Transcript_4709/g.6198  ORF Transcript_4709/g.6198 Transcript_4709/m.6198 type:complete len:169 (+) Transcript_4709:581-1087(+)
MSIYSQSFHISSNHFTTTTPMNSSSSLDSLDHKCLSIAETLCNRPGNIKSSRIVDTFKMCHHPIQMTASTKTPPQDIKTPFQDFKKHSQNTKTHSHHTETPPQKTKTPPQKTEVPSQNTKVHCRTTENISGKIAMQVHLRMVQKLTQNLNQQPKQKYLMTLWEESDEL